MSQNVYCYISENEPFVIESFNPLYELKNRKLLWVEMQ